MARRTITPEEKAAKEAAKQEAKKVASEPTAQQPLEQATENSSATDQSAPDPADAPDVATPDPTDPNAAVHEETASKQEDRISTEEPTATEDNIPMPPNAQNPLERAGNRILAAYPSASKVYITSDGFGFFREHDARNHADGLRNKHIVTVKRK